MRESGCHSGLPFFRFLFPRLEMNYNAHSGADRSGGRRDNLSSRSPVPVDHFPNDRIIPLSVGSPDFPPDSTIG
ncbi:MAG: hypothetical protein COV67_12840 [Nitrospinae bacterium CG11_big_fil_rev_8_21_14_0_20_56_8]|nr:MAG: hypothetical protein COV67_12840 [Nitrospinae bacterium CG11_big_fil_rev_8_21_14_0_20_56_8]